MRGVRAWLIRFGGLLRKRWHDQELAEELESHLEMNIQENLQRGMGGEQARREALMKLGGMTQTEQIYRERRGLPVLETFLHDVRFAARMLRKDAGFAVVAILVMAFGIGANTAMFSVVNAVLLRPLAYKDPDRIVRVSTLWKKDGHHGSASAPDFHDWHDQSTAFQTMASYEGDEVAVAAGPAAEYARVTTVSSEFFATFRVEPIAGREFSTEEMKPGSSAAAMISYAYSVNHFGGASNALGRTVRLLDKTLNVVGVMPPGFRYPDNTDLWFPAGTLWPDTTSRSAHNYRVVARLKAGVSLEQAQAQMTAIGSRLEEKYPDSNSGKSVAVTRMRDEMVRNFRLMLWVMLGGVGVVLLIACANLANMLLAKSVARTKEMAIRAAMGAARGRIVRQLITESLFLALLSGGLGVLLAQWACRALVASAPADVPRLPETGIDMRVLAFAFAVSVLATVLFGLAPALQVLRVDLNESLKQSTTRATGGSLGDRLRAVLIVSEVALCLLLLTGAGLLLRSFIALQNVNMGFRPERILVMQTSVPASGLESERRAARFYKDLLAEIAALPGAVNAGAAGAIPGDSFSNGGYFIDYLPKERGVNAPQAAYAVVTPGTFATEGVSLLRGRDFNDADTYDQPFSAIINEKLAKAAFPGRDPIGHLIYWGLDSDKPMKIVGVVGDIRNWSPADPPWPEIYGAYQQHPGFATNLKVLVRTAVDPNALAETIRQKAQALSPDVPVKFTTVEAFLSESIAVPRFRTVLLAIFAGLAVCLAMAGVYGVMSYVVGQRANEIGLRMALGASRTDVLTLVLRQAFMLTVAGIVVGLLCAAAATRLLTSMLFEIKRSDPLTYVAVIALLAAVALLASYIPARRAMRVDPMVALRYE
jgi:putative ABC transport system permease protein